jgi:hypothetical protein
LDEETAVELVPLLALQRDSQMVVGKDREMVSMSVEAKWVRR